MIRFNNIREFYCFVDIVTSTIVKGDVMEIPLKYSGIIIRKGLEDFDRVHVGNTSAVVRATYDENGLYINSTAAKSVADWLSKAKQGTYSRANSYLSFIESIDELYVDEVLLNCVDIIDGFEYNEKLDIVGLVRYATEKTGNKNMKITLSNGRRNVTLQYGDDLFSRFVRLESFDTLYVNNDESMRKMFDGYYISNFVYGFGIPCITSQMQLFEKIAADDGCTFRYRAGK